MTCPHCAQFLRERNQAHELGVLLRAALHVARVGLLERGASETDADVVVIDRAVQWEVRTGA